MLRFTSLLTIFLFGSGIALAMPTAQELALRHQDGLEAIQTLQANFERKITGLPSGDIEQKGTYLRSGSEFAIKQEISNTINSIHGNDKWIRTVLAAKSKTASVYKAHINSPDEPLESDLYNCLCFYLHDGAFLGRRISLKDFYAHGETTVDAEGTGDALQYRVLTRCIQVGVPLEITTWHSPKRNYLLTKFERRSPKDNRRGYTTIELSDWLFKDGACLPQRATVTGAMSGQVDQTQTTFLSQVQLNEPLDKTKLQLPGIPNGVVCNDSIRMKKYKIDSAWNRMGDETDWAPMKVDVASDASVGTFDRRASSNVGSWTVWNYIALGCATILVAYAIFRMWIYMKSRRSKLE